MVAVAMIALVLGGAAALMRRRAFALAMAARHRDDYRRVTMMPLYRSERPPLLVLYVEHHIEMEWKWMEAARHPWRAVAPDPPNLTDPIEVIRSQ